MKRSLPYVFFSPATLAPSLVRDAPAPSARAAAPTYTRFASPLRAAVAVLPQARARQAWHVDENSPFARGFARELPRVAADARGAAGLVVVVGTRHPRGAPHSRAPPRPSASSRLSCARPASWSR